MRAWYGILLAGCVFWLVACGATNSPPSDASSPTTRTASSPGDAVSQTAVGTLAPSTPLVADDSFELPTRVPTVTRSATPGASRPIVLTLWVPEEFATGAERGGDVLDRQIAEFEIANPGIKLNYVLKAPYDKGGIVDWLTQLQELMPERLPDAAIVDSRELDRLQALGLLHSLNRALPSGVYWDLFPPAQQIARRQGQWNNQPLTLDTEHLVYDARRVTAPPLSWQSVLTDTTQFAFAADSTETFLFHYLENGGSLDPRAHPASDVNLMQSILDYYQRARANGNLTENTAGMKSAREVMPLFVSGQTPMAQVRARDFLIERARLPDALAAPIPTRGGRATTLVSGWSFVILTDDKAKQDAAARYLEWLIEPTHMGEWSSAARMVPAGKSAFAIAIDSPEYAELLWNLFQDALVAPGFGQQQPYADAWHNAVAAVLNGQLAPDDAAFRAVQAITQ